MWTEPFSIVLTLALSTHARPSGGPLGWQHGYGNDGLTVDTTSGQVTGFVNETAPQVRQWLGIPYAEPPVGSLRFAPPQPKANGGALETKAFAPSCMQQFSNASTIYTEEVPQFLINGGQSEDCLYINIWAPEASKCEDEKLPVFVYIPGGGFTSGGADSVYKIPDKWIQRTQSHIVVIMNYRVNVFGFSNAKGLGAPSANVGLLDQRLVVEWTRDNIAGFGGDPERITLWGQSAGGASVSLYGYSYPDDPIVAALIADSGAATIAGSRDLAQTNFTFLAGLVGCGDLAPGPELDCVRKVPAMTLENTLSYYLGNRTTTQPSINFTPIPDNVTAFGNTTDRAARGLVADVPLIMGSNTNEGAGFVPFTPNGPGAAVLYTTTQTIIACPVAAEIANRVEFGYTTYRYQYAGNFSNVSPLPWMGAYHSSELPMLFGTHYEFRGNSTQFEYEVSETMEALWYSFASDGTKAPHATLPSAEEFTWPKYDPNSNTMVQFAKGDTLLQLVSGSIIDGNCTAS